MGGMGSDLSLCPLRLGRDSTTSLPGNVAMCGSDRWRLWRGVCYSRLQFHVTLARRFHGLDG